ncbi:MAG: hypothetical protein ACK4QW_11140 [Alphaproteobacteria bacterium]
MRRTIAILLCLTLPACGGARLDDGTIRLGDDVVMVPSGQDAVGCPQFRMSSGTRGMLSLPFYRTAAGDFTTNRADAACGR